MILNSLYLFDGTTEVIDSEVISNVKGSILTLQIKCDSTFELEIQGNLLINDEDYTVLGAIDMTSLSKKTSITTEGIYQIDISGCRKVKASIVSIGESPLTVYATVKEG